MARFAGSQVSFDPQALQAAGMSSDYSSAAGVVDLGESFASMRNKAPRFDQLSAEAMKNQAAENVAAMESEADVAGKGLDAFGTVKGSLLEAQGRIKAAKAAAAGKQGAAGISAIGGIIGTGMKLLSGGMA
jgi:hypothetical protein